MLNLRQMCHVYQFAETVEGRYALTSLDLEKGFDTIDHQLLFLTLEQYKFALTFVAWIKLLYTSPTANIRTGNFVF